MCNERFVQSHRGIHVAKGVMCLGGSERNTEVMTEGLQLEIVRWRAGWVLEEVPQGSLKRAKDLVSGRAEYLQPLVPGVQKRCVKGRIVSDKLGC